MSVAQPAPQWQLLDRYLASVEVSELAALICLTKLDLIRGADSEKTILRHAEEYSALGYTVLLTSAGSGEGIDALRDKLAGKLSVLIGKSGVGKTSLLNALQPGLGQQKSTRSSTKAANTTTHLEMFGLEGGGYIVDTPGMKQFGLWAIEPEDVALQYREIAPYVGRCKFGLDCTHHHEPGCAVKVALKRGEISQRRYESHLRRNLYAEE
jgi:ribosome biogenesis GTPase